MRKWLLILVVAVLLTISVVGLLIFGFDGGGFGRGRGADNNTVRPLSLIVFMVPLVLAAGILGYAVTFPTIEEQKEGAKPDGVSTAETKGLALDAVLRVLDEDEKKVIAVLVGAENKTMLQKDIRWNTRLSRVKTHRVLYRLAKKGIVTVEKHYNTNRVALAEWLTKER